MKFYNKMKRNLQLFWHSLFRGMAAADTVIKAPVGSENSSEIVQQMKRRKIIKLNLRKLIGQVLFMGKVTI